MSFAERVLAWFDRHGRKDLPWQSRPDAYRVWISEIMLQQTQVNTVIPYYQKFMQRFPDIQTLAQAALDEVLQHWAGLGYYARARNLHRAAQHIMQVHSGCFPETFDAVSALPGIGRSTAGAILALAKQQRHAILDGNVKRVLARYFVVDGWPGQPQTAAQLWAHAEALLPARRVGDYTQAMMDLGATVCTRSKPRCDLCPVHADCQALAMGQVLAYPQPKPRKTLPVKQTQMLILRNHANEYLLQRRPPVGIWGGLLSLPEIDPQQDPVEWAQQTIGDVQITTRWDWFRHTFTHFHLDIRPVLGRLQKASALIQEHGDWVWYNTHQPVGGLAAPTRKLIEQTLQLEND